MGWWMATGGWRSAAGPFPPNLDKPDLPDIGPGLHSYATGGWGDPGTGIVKTAYPLVSVGKHTTDVRDPANVVNRATMWPAYTSEINAGRPVEVTFTNWVDTNLPALPDTTTFPGLTIEEYAWLTAGDPHSVVGVGYYDATPGMLDNDGTEFFICQDGWGTTGQYVRVPVDNHWMQNDYVYSIPEPATATLILMALAPLAVRRRRA
jgi:hypothetical protein